MFQSLPLDTYLAQLKTLEKQYNNSVIRAIVNSYMVYVKVLQEATCTHFFNLLSVRILVENRIPHSESTEKTLTQVRTELREPTNDTEVPGAQQQWQKVMTHGGLKEEGE